MDIFIVLPGEWKGCWDHGSNACLVQGYWILHLNPSFPATILSEMAKHLLFHLHMLLLTSSGLTLPQTSNASLGRLK